MDVKYINPFISAAADVFSKMLGATARRGTPQLAKPNPNDVRLITVIGMSGSHRGAVAIFFPVETALQLTRKTLCCEKDEVDMEVKDVVAEFTNMIAGAAKAQMSLGEGPPIALGLPTVISGQSTDLSFQTGSPWVEIPFESDLGAFFVQVSIEEGHRPG